MLRRHRGKFQLGVYGNNESYLSSLSLMFMLTFCHDILIYMGPIPDLSYSLMTNLSDAVLLIYSGGVRIGPCGM